MTRIGSSNENQGVRQTRGAVAARELPEDSSLRSTSAARGSRFSRALPKLANLPRGDGRRPARYLTQIRRDKNPPPMPGASAHGAESTSGAKGGESFHAELPVSVLNSVLNANGPIDLGYATLSGIVLSSSDDSLNVEAIVDRGSRSFVGHLAYAATLGNVPGLAKAAIDVEPKPGTDGKELRLNLDLSVTSFKSDSAPFKVQTALSLKITQGESGPQLTVALEGAQSNRTGVGYLAEKGLHYAAKEVLGSSDTKEWSFPLVKTGIPLLNTEVAVHAPRLSFEKGRIVVSSGLRVGKEEEPTKGGEQTNRARKLEKQVKFHQGKNTLARTASVDGQDEAITLTTTINGKSLGEAIGNVKLHRQVELTDLEFKPSRAGVEFSAKWGRSAIKGTVSSSPDTPGAMRLNINRGDTSSRVIKSLTTILSISKNPINIDAALVHTKIGPTARGAFVEIIPKLHNLDLKSLAGASLGRQLRSESFRHLGFETVPGDAHNVRLVAKPDASKIKADQIQVGFAELKDALLGKPFIQSTVKGSSKIGPLRSIDVKDVERDSSGEVVGCKVNVKVSGPSKLHNDVAASGLLKFYKEDTSKLLVEFVRDDGVTTPDYPGINAFDVINPYFSVDVKELVSTDFSSRELVGMALKTSSGSNNPPVLELDFNDRLIN